MAKWIKVQGHCGVPMTYTSVAQAATEISGKSVGEVWPKWFLQCHSDLKMKKTAPLESVWEKALNQTVVDMLADVVKEYNIQPGDMDEKGIQLGIGV